MLAVAATAEGPHLKQSNFCSGKRCFSLDVSKNSGFVVPPKSQIIHLLIGFSMDKNTIHFFGYLYFWKHPVGFTQETIRRWYTVYVWPSSLGANWLRITGVNLTCSPRWKVHKYICIPKDPGSPKLRMVMWPRNYALEVIGHFPVILWQYERMGIYKDGSRWLYIWIF